MSFSHTTAATQTVDGRLNGRAFHLSLVILVMTGLPQGLQARQPAGPTVGYNAGAVKQQTPPVAKTSIYVEVLGNGGLYSLNVERLLSDRVAARIGFGSWATGDAYGAGEESVFTFPLMANVLFGRGSSRLETGAGLLLGHSAFTSSWGDESDSNNPIAALTGVLGYRRFQADGGFLFRIGVMPFLDLTGGHDPYPDAGLSISAGLSFGYRF